MIKNALINLVKLYQFLASPLVGNSCRFTPSCSSYMIESIKIHGIIKGVYLGVKRILKCNPFFKGGIDYPKEKK